MRRPNCHARSIPDTPTPVGSSYFDGSSRVNTLPAYLVVLLATLALPEVALAGGGTGGIAPVEAQLTAIVDFIRGPAGVAICTIGLIAAIGGMVFNSQRGRPIGSFAIAAVGIVLFFAAPEIVAFLSAQGALL